VALDGVKMPLSTLRGDVALEDDLLIGELTVKESLRAALNLKQKLSKDEVCAMQYVLLALHMPASTADQRPALHGNGLSGGRASLALTLFSKRLAWTTWATTS